MKMALKKVKGTLERVLEKNVQDLVRGIRNHKDNEAKYIAECLDEIKQELRQDNLSIKANAVNKLTYLQMNGYDISWAAFNIIEVMSSTKFTFKRIGYIAASQSFNDNTDVLMLTTNMIRKDLNSQNMYDCGVALSSLSVFITTDLARDLATDILTLLSSTKPYIRKKAVLILYKVFLKFPESLRPAFPRLKDKLEDPDPGVQSAAVNVICELARKNPQNYLSLAPLFFKLLTSSANNWLLIKIIKLFGSLTPLEPRLGKKLIEPLTNLIHSTSAMSLLYECINTVVAVLISISSGIPNHSSAIQLCVQKLRILIEDTDQNLKYLGLLAMSRILETHPKSVQSHKDLILQCLDDRDESIRLRALDLLHGMVSKKNLMEIVKKLMVHLGGAEGSFYRDELMQKVVDICSQSNYQYVTNFEWYITVLVELSRIEGTRHGKLIASQMLDVTIRVQAIRPFAVSQMAILLENIHYVSNNVQRNSMCEVLYAAGWICGEFAQHLSDPKITLEAMLQPKITTLGGHIQSVYIQNIIKLYVNVVSKAEQEENREVFTEMSNLLTEKLPMFIQSADLEVQERACCVLQLIKYIVKSHEKGDSVTADLSTLFSSDLNPVAIKAQKKVPVPEGLDLDKWIYEPLSESSDEDTPVSIFLPTHAKDDYRSYTNEESKYEPSAEELEKMREQRQIEQQNNPHYLKAAQTKFQDQEAAGMTAIDLTIPLHVPGLSSSDRYLQISRSQAEVDGKKKKKPKKKKKGRKESTDDEVAEVPTHTVSTTMEMPEGAVISDHDEPVRDETDPHKLLDINLDAPLRADEVLPVRMHRVAASSVPEPAEDATALDKPKKKHRHNHHSSKHDGDRKKKDKSKREKRHSVDRQDDGAADLIECVENEHSVPISNDIDSSNHQREITVESEAVVEDKSSNNDMDFWLSPNDVVTQNSIPEICVSEEIEPVASNKQKTKKDKKLKKGGKREKKEKRNKRGYEEPEGITTPSKEDLPPSVTPNTSEIKLPPMSSYVLLGENSSVKMTYEVRSIPHRADMITLSIIIHNLSDQHIKNLEFNVLDTINTKLVRQIGISSSEAVRIGFDLPPNLQNQAQFSFMVDSIQVPQKLRGTLTYIIKNESGSSQDKIDFKIHLPCSAFLVSTHLNGPEYASLLSGGKLVAKESIKFSPIDQEISHVLAKICFYLHFTVVEQVDESASLYSQSIRSDHVCLLVKQLDNHMLNVDGKSSDQQLLSNVLAEIKALLNIRPDQIS